MPGSDLVGLVWKKKKDGEVIDEKNVQSTASPTVPAKGQFMGLRGQALSHVIGVTAATFFFLYGYDQGDMGGFLTVQNFLHRFTQVGVVNFPDSLKVAQMTAITVGIWNLGCLCSAVLTIFLSDRFGRKSLMFVGLVLLLIGQIIQATSFAWGQFLAGRFIAGLGNGFNCATVPAWQAECTKAHRRGTLLMLTAGAAIAAGMAFSYWMDFAFAWIDNSASWRVPIALQIIFIFAIFPVIGFMPESPRWLILQGREDEALNILSALNDMPHDAHEIRQEFLQIKDAVIEMSQASFRNVFKMGDYRDFHRVILAVGLQFMQQITGINFMTQYYANMFQLQYKWGAWQARLLSAGAGTEFFLMSFVAVWAIDRICGRRGLLMFGSAGMTVSMVILTIMLEINNRASLDAGTAFIFVFCTFYACSWQGISWLYQVEIVPLRIRGPANALSTAANWTANFICVIIAAPGFKTIKWKLYIVFACTNVVIFPLIYFFYPETSLRCLEEVDYIFHTANSSPRPWLDVRKIAADIPLWYGRDMEEAYDYESSEWHQRHVRFSDEVKDSEGETTTLRATSDGGYMEKLASSSSGSEEEKPRDNGDLAAPSPIVGRTSRDSQSRSRSSGRGR
ncbi:hypothetical protein PRZ48_003930 [Zasmidium cellare]|uniref:Major facilitator superfamily (MFS) profile domain-containing protein n=1 Tax=Zasmidium cellare TaxID=395010 RepID=A0ABR0EY17_ZASCE|nr:hypothetical protein PRZ48_003930 [Zasmidium cellare]